MPIFQKANRLIALSAFALSATFFAAPAMHAATTAADTAAAASTSADATSTSADAAPAADAATPDPQTAAPAAAPAAPAAPPTWSVGPIDFSGLVDGYYNFNANHPTYGGIDYPEGNQLRAFDTAANSFALSMVKLSMSHSADPVGFQVDLIFGPAASTSTAPFGLPTAPSNFPNDIEQAYVSWKPTKGKGFEADFGQFVTSAGAEVIESMNNPNYSRSLLFEYLIPLYHIGLRTSMPITKTDTFGIQIVNGWNGSNATDSNAGKTFGFVNAYTKPNFSWDFNYYVGPENGSQTLNEQPPTDVGYRNLIDTTLNLTPVKHTKWTGYLNYDYVQNRDAAANATGTGYHTTDLVHEQGIAVEGRYQATGTIAFSGRYEYLADESGLITSHVKAGLNEFTLTGEYKMAEGLLARLEYRRDATDNPFFVKGQEANPNALVKAQSTLEFGVVAFFGPHR